MDTINSGDLIVKMLRYAEDIEKIVWWNYRTIHGLLVNSNFDFLS
jgi:hypothetical protein